MLQPKQDMGDIIRFAINIATKCPYERTMGLTRCQIQQDTRKNKLRLRRQYQDTASGKTSGAPANPYTMIDSAIMQFKYTT